MAGGGSYPHNDERRQDDGETAFPHLYQCTEDDVLSDTRCRMRQTDKEAWCAGCGECDEAESGAMDGDGKENDIQLVGLISNKTMGAKELGKYKRGHWVIENTLHHVLDDSFREDRSPAKKSKNNLALIRKFAYNILRIAMLCGDCSKTITEAMDDFCDDRPLLKRYVFDGILSFY